MREKINLKRILLYLVFNIFLAVTAVSAMATVWMIRNKYVYESVESILEKEIAAKKETIAARLLHLFFVDGDADAVTAYCKSQGIHYIIYHVNGSRKAGNVTYTQVGTFYFESDEISFDENYDGYYSFPGIQNYKIQLSFLYKPEIVKIEDPEYYRYWSVTEFLVKYKTVLWIGFGLFALLSLGMAKRLRKKYTVDGSMNHFPMDVQILISAALMFAVACFKADAKDVVAVILRYTILAWLAGNALATVYIRTGESGWYKKLSVTYLFGVLVRSIKEKKRSTQFQKTLRIYTVGIILVSVFEIAMIVRYTDAHEIFITCLVIEKLLLLLFIVKHLNKYRLLQDYAAKIAEGNFDNKVDVDALPLFLQKLGENLNAIDGSVSIAVSERMKSEHFKTELITNVSHDLKTPLTSIINFSDLIMNEDTDNEKVREYAEHLFKQSTRLKKLMEDLIEASRASTGNIEAHMEPCDARVILGQCQGEFVPRLTDCDIELVVKNCAEQLHIMADPTMLARVFDNLLSNICKYTLPGTRVYISTEKVDGKARITFKNTSKNRLDDISADELMERFVRGDLSRHTEGHGLGLSIVKSLMDLQQGKVELSVDGDLFKVMLEFKILEGGRTVGSGRVATIIE